MGKSVDRDYSFDLPEKAATLDARYEEWLQEYIRTYHSLPHTIYSSYSPSPAELPISLNSCWRSDQSTIGGFFRGFLAPLSLFPRTKWKVHCHASSDAEALLHDWVMVGTDLHKAMHKYSKLASHGVRSTDSAAYSDEWETVVR